MAYIPADAIWYLADIMLEYTIAGDPRNVVHVNSNLIRADSPEQAYEKAMALGQSNERTYANTDGKEVRVVFRGLRELNVIHDALEDEAELTYNQYIALPESKLAEWARPKESLAVFAEQVPGFETGEPNYAPESVIKMLEDAGFDRNAIT